jgi:hypothetical protein
MRNICLNAHKVKSATQIHALQYHCALIALNMESACFFETPVNFYSKKKITSENIIKSFTFQHHLGTKICVISKILGRLEVEASRTSRQSSQESGKFVSPTHHPHPWFSFLLELNTLRRESFKLFKRPFPGFLTILTL